MNDHPFQRFDRLEILRRDLGLRNREVEFGFDREHQVDHVHRGQPDIHQPRFGSDVGCDRVLLEDRLDEGKDTVLNVGAKACICQFPPVAPMPSSPRPAMPKSAVTIALIAPRPP